MDSHKELKPKEWIMNTSIEAWAKDLKGIEQ